MFIYHETFINKYKYMYEIKHRHVNKLCRHIYMYIAGMLKTAQTNFHVNTHVHTPRIDDGMHAKFYTYIFLIMLS